MKKFLAYTIALVVGVLFSAAAYAGQVPGFTGPAGSNPYDPSNIAGVFNQIIQSYDLAIGNGAALGTHVGLFSEGGFQYGGVTSTGSLTLGSVFPSPSTLASTTVKFFITFFDSKGVQSFIPVWQ